MIVKVQKPLNVPDGPWLVYGENREHMEHYREQDLPEHVRKTLITRPKAYFEATRSNDRWSIGKRVDAQSW